MRSILFFFVLLGSSFHALADGAGDNTSENVRRIPKLGVEVPQADRDKLEEQLAAFEKQISRLRLRSDALTRELLADVLIYHKAAHDALKYQEFFDAKEIPVAFALIKEGMERASQLEQGKPLWPQQTGLVVRGYISKIDGSVQPYGLVIPKSYSDTGPRVRCDIWFHGRGETLSELNFINGRRNSIGEYAPADTIVLHPYGRYCNANKFAGEIDTLEALEAVQQQYRIDEDRISVRGFSMGGAAAWQFATHYTDRWFAANPGAGFSETPDFLKVFQNETLAPTWWEKKLWHYYDCTDYALNLYNLPTVAYSGEIDKQKQAADIMATALLKEQMKLTHIIGPNTAHKIHPDSKRDIEQRMAAIAKFGRPHAPFEIRLTTYTLRYNRMYWVTIDELTEHWEKATVRAENAIDDNNQSTLFIEVKNVAAFSINLPSGAAHFRPTDQIEVNVNGDVAAHALRPETDGSFHLQIHDDNGAWKVGPRPANENITRKSHGLQGPIDDAFMDSFIFVRPTGKARNELVDKWSKAELERAIEHWRRHFRGEARVKDDTAITDADIAGANLILWGDPQSNAVMKKIADRLPIAWNEKAIVLGETSLDSTNHALISISPNPLNPKRYVVLNSSFTFRDYAYLNNARQVPMLPDWAVVDLRTPANAVWPGKVVEAGFYDEAWKLSALKK